MTHFYRPGICALFGTLPCPDRLGGWAGSGEPWGDCDSRSDSGVCRTGGRFRSLSSFCSQIYRLFGDVCPEQWCPCDVELHPQKSSMRRLSIRLASARARLDPCIRQSRQSTRDTKPHAHHWELMESVTPWGILVARTRSLPRTSMRPLGERCAACTDGDCAGRSWI